MDRRLLKERSLHEIQVDYGKKRRNVIIEDDAYDNYQNVFYRARGVEYAYQFAIRGDSFEPPTNGVGISFPRDQTTAIVDIDLPVRVPFDVVRQSLLVREGATVTIDQVRFTIVTIRSIKLPGGGEGTQVEVHQDSPSGWRVDINSPQWIYPGKGAEGGSLQSTAQRKTNTPTLIFESEQPLPEGTRLIIEPTMWRPETLGQIPLDPVGTRRARPASPAPARDIAARTDVRDVRFIGVCQITDERVDAWNASGHALPDLAIRLARSLLTRGPINAAYGMKLRYLVYETPRDIYITTESYNSLDGLVPTGGMVGELKFAAIQTDPARRSGKVRLKVTDYSTPGERTRTITTPVFRLDPLR